MSQDFHEPFVSGEVTHLSAEALATALRLGFNQVWMIDSSKRIEDEIVVPTPRGCVNWSVTPRGQVSFSIYFNQ